MLTDTDFFLRKYYEKVVRCNSMKSFEELTHAEKRLVEGMWGFAFFRAAESLRQVKELIRKKLPLN